MNTLNKKIYIHDLIAKQVYGYDRNNPLHNNHTPFIQIMKEENLLVMNVADYVYTNHEILHN